MCHTLVCYCYCYCVAVEDPGLERSTCDHDWHNLMWANNSIKVWCKYNMNSTQIQQKYQYDSFSDQWHVWVPKLGEIEGGRRSVRKVKSDLFFSPFLWLHFYMTASRAGVGEHKLMFDMLHMQHIGSICLACDYEWCLNWHNSGKPVQ